jgi:exonuclease III
MKLVSFNIWGGKIYEPLMDYIISLSGDTDIFCFQEVFSALPGTPEVSSGARMFLFQELSAVLPEFVGFFEARSINYDYKGAVDKPVCFGSAIFVRKSLWVSQYSGRIIEQSNNLIDPIEGWIKAQVLTIEDKDRRLAVINFHGVALPGDKLDTPQRLGHAKQLQLIWDSLPGLPKILCGDFNLFPETESIKILEGLGKNLIKEFKIQSTRNEVSWKIHNNVQHFADYAFVSSEVKVKSFEVPYNEVSDHLPMILEFEV